MAKTEDEHHGPERVRLDPAAARELETHRIERGEVADSLRLTAEVGWNEDRLAHLTPRISGRVVEVSAVLGQSVQKGQVLAVLDSIELGEAKAAFLAAKSRLSLAQRNYEREEGLYEKRISSEREYLEARNSLEESKITLETYRQRLRLLGISDEDIANLVQTESLSRFPVRAPFAGTVVEKHVSPGEVLDMGEEILTVVDTGTVWVWLNVYEKDLSQIQTGNRIELETRAYPGRPLQGVITFLGSRVLSETRTIRVRADVKNPRGLLRAGMFGIAKTSGNGTRTGIFVPEGALQEVEGRNVLFVEVEPGEYEMREVVPGSALQGNIEILDGVEAGEVLVTKGAFALKSEHLKAELGGGHSH